MKKVLVLFFAVWCGIQANAQLGDSLTLGVLDYQRFDQLVRTNHPIAQQAALRIDAADAGFMRARGAFDPKIESAIQQKYFSETPYYSYQSTQLKYATPFALELKAGLDLNEGYYLSEENATPEDGLLLAGASLPLLQGLLMDERRAMRQQAEVIREFSEVERESLLNQLLLDAGKSYWNWWNAAERSRVSADMLNLAIQRFDAVRARALTGDRPLIDTVDAFLNKQLRLQQFQEAIIHEIKMRGDASTFIWRAVEGRQDPVWLTDLVKPQTQEPDLVSDNADLLLTSVFLQRVDSIEKTNPDALLYESKLKQLAIEERWKREKLKPKLNLEYNFLSEAVNSPEGAEFSTRNYKWGGSFSIPILLREGRGDLKLQRIKIMETEYSFDQKVNDLQAKARMGQAALNQLLQQLVVITDNLVNYERLLEAERTRFFNGESSLLLVNIREQQYTEAQIKRLDTILKIKEQELDIRFSLGDM